MDEPRLIDATELRSAFDTWLSLLDDNNPDHQLEGSTIYNCALRVDNAPTVDPETLPLVRALRAENAELMQHNAERARISGSKIAEQTKTIDELREKLIRANAELDAINRLLEHFVFPSKSPDTPDGSMPYASSPCRNCIWGLRVWGTDTIRCGCEGYCPCKKYIYGV